MKHMRLVERDPQMGGAGGDRTKTKSRRKIPAPKRFWAKVNKRGARHPELGRCWEWTGCIVHGGYGQFRDGTGRRQRAHRFSYQDQVRPIPKGKMCLHKCDNRACVNPDHLYIGTHEDNVRDFMARCRQRCKTEPVSDLKMTPPC